MTSLNDPVEVLLVEDNLTDGELCIRALKKQGLADRLVWAKDGSEAVEFLCGTGAYAGRDVHDRPKVVLLDLRLPKLDGFEVLRKIRDTDELQALPVVLLTSSNEDCDIEAGYRLGANSFISKPVEFAQYGPAMADVARYWMRLNKPPYDRPVRTSAMADAP